MSGVLLADRYMSPMTEADLDEVAAIEKIAYEFPWSRGNFGDSLRNGYFGICMRHVTGTLIGYCVLMPVVDEMHLLNLCSRCCAKRCALRAPKNSKACCSKCGRRIIGLSGFTSVSALRRLAGAKTIIRRGIAAGRTPS
jgi:hypothetical protein